MFDKFDGSNRKPREIQLDVLKFLHDTWANPTVGLNLPTGVGKTAIAMSVLNASRHAFYIVSSNQLMDQVVEDYKDLNFLRGKEHYTCGSFKSKVSCAEQPKPCDKCPYSAAKLRAVSGEPSVLNPYSFAYLKYTKGYRPVKVLVVDECFTPDMEILTEKGFFRFDELPKNLKVAQVDVGTNSLTFVEPLRYVEKEVERHRVITVQSDRNIDVSATENHDFVVKTNRDTNISKIKLKYVRSHTHKILKAMPSTGVERSMTKIEKFNIMFQADGSHHSDGLAHFTFSKQRKIDEFLQFMGEEGFDYKEISGRDGIGNVKAKRRFSVRPDFYFTKNLWEVFCLDKLDKEKCEKIIEWMVKWDGSIIHDNLYYYSCVDEKNTDFYQSVAILAGYGTNKTVQVDRRSENFKDVHRLFIRKDSSEASLQGAKFTENLYTGKVYCVSVPAGNIVVRRSGKPLVVGNCHLLIDTLLEMAAVSIPGKRYGRPQKMQAREVALWLRKVADNIETEAKNEDDIIKSTRLKQRAHRIVGVAANLEDEPELYAIYKDELFVHVKPVKIPERVRKKFFDADKVILMSASLNRSDMNELFGSKYEFYEPPVNPIPKANRQTIQDFAPVAMNKDTDIKLIAMWIEMQMKKFPNLNTMVHVTYADQEKLKPFFPEAFYNSKQNKSEVIAQFKQKGGLFIASGLAEGVDLKGDECRLNLIPKLIKPSLYDEAVKKRKGLTAGDKWYNVKIMTTLQQQVGRSTRGPDDWSIAVVGDKNLVWIMNSVKDLLPKSFVESFTKVLLKINR